MQPVLLKLGPIPINSYGLMIGIGFIVGLTLVLRDARKAGLNDKAMADAAFYVLPIAILGTRLLHIIMFPANYSWNDPIGWIAIWRGGLVFQGALPVSMLFLWFYLKKRNVDFWKVCDVTAPYLPLAHAFGRMGCFLNGCCYGLPSDMPWAIPFRRIPWDTSLPVTGSLVFRDHLQRFADLTPDSHWSHPVHPTQLYEALGLVAMCLLIRWIGKRWHPYDGVMVPVYFVMYGTLRFIVEFFRGDHNPTSLFGLSDQQLFSVAFALFGVVMYFVLARRRRGAERLRTGEKVSGKKKG